MIRIGAGLVLLLLTGAAARPFSAAGAVRPAVEPPVRPKVLLLTYDPVIEAEGGKRLSAVCRWNDPAALTRDYLADVRECSGDYLQYRVVDERVLDAFPLKKDGFRYNDDSFMQAFRTGKGWHEPDAIDYPAILREFAVAPRVDRGEIDEVWIQAMPYSGLLESTMAGKGAYFCNSDPLPGVEASRIFVIMGFNYERGGGEMLEDLGHRTESIMRRVYGSWEAEPTHAWNRFTLYDRVAPGRAACGNVHFAPNSAKDYDWGNRTPVLSSADDWLSYPNLTGKQRLMTCADWGNGDIRLHHKWWLTRLPKAPGLGPDGKQANWWKYVGDFNHYPESR
jgi:hypothetical protein